MGEASDRFSVSVVIPARDPGRALDRLLGSLRENVPADVEVEIVVVDDGSREDLASTCLTFGASFVRVPESRGPAHARNLGARRARYDTLLFLDADVLCPPGLIERTRSVLAARPRAAALSFVNPPFDPARGTVANFAAVLEHEWLSFYLGESRSESPLPGVTTRNVVVRRSAFEGIGGFDPSFTTNGIEDYDFGHRLAERGESWLADRPWVPHEFPGRLGRLARNYWVRAATFVPYYLRQRPRLDPVQVAPGEAALRLLGAAIWGLVVATPFAGSGAALSAGTSVALAAVYGLALRGFLAAAARASGSRAFAAKAFALHLLTSPVIVLGAIWGLGRFAAEAVAPGRRPGLTRSAGDESA